MATAAKKPNSVFAALRPYWFAAFTAMIVLLPLPFGANRPWASDLFGTVSALLLIAMAFDVYRMPEMWPAGAPEKNLKISAILLSITVFWAFLQTQSWMPSGLHHPLWQNVKDMTGTSAGSISIDPDQFPESASRLLGYVICFLLAFVAGRDKERARAFLLALAIAGSIYAFYGLLMQSTGLRMVLWYKKWAYSDFVTSTFVNKNSYATYAGLGLQVCLALLWLRIKHKPESQPDRQSQFSAWMEKLFRQDAFYLIMCLIVLGGLLMTGSRAGIASSLAGCVVLLIALAVNRRWDWKIWLPVLFVGLAVFIAYLLISGSMLLDRLDHGRLEYETPQRLQAYAIIMRAIANNPLLGFGLGSFESAFRLYRDPGFDMWFQHAHNDYLELALELGVPAALMLISSILIMVACCVKGVWKRHRQEIFPALGLSASITVGLHSLADFSMQMPAVAATYAALLGLGVAQSWSSRNEGMKSRNAKLGQRDTEWLG